MVSQNMNYLVCSLSLPYYLDSFINDMVLFKLLINDIDLRGGEIVRFAEDRKLFRMVKIQMDCKEVQFTAI